jgi:hypothetical protein
MRMYPVGGRGEACLRPKTVFICVYHGWVRVPGDVGTVVNVIGFSRFLYPFSLYPA